MNLTEELLREHTKKQALHVAELALTSPARFKQLVRCFAGHDQKLAQRAAWSLSWAVRKKPAFIGPHLPAIATAIQRKDVHPAVTRNALKVLEEVTLPASYHGEVMNACFAILESPSALPACKAYSMTILARLANIYPEIKPELKLLIEDQWENETPAFRARGRKVLKGL